MWHAARKQEKMIRVMMVDYQKRAGRRREYYECIKQDPNQFLRVYGRSMKIHIDPSLAAAAEGPQVMQPWQGDPDVHIDRYDVRSHIDHLPPIHNMKATVDDDENRCSYERYRILVQNDCANVSEDQCLQQIHHDEQFGPCDSSKSEEEKKKKLAEKRTAIGFIYDDGSSGTRMPDFKKEMEDDDVSDEEIDLDNILDIDMLTEEQEQVLNALSVEYGMEGNDYSDFLQLDREEMEAIRAVKQIEEEKAQFSGRKSRRERRAFKERRLRNKKLSPPSYAAKTPNPSTLKLSSLKGSSSSRSSSESPAGAGVIEFITSFGGDAGGQSSDEGARKPILGPSLPPLIIGPKLPEKDRGRRSRSREKVCRSPRGRSRSPGRRSRTPRRRSRGRSRSKERYRSRRSRSISEDSRTRSTNGYRRRSPSYARKGHSRRSRRSESYKRSVSRSASRGGRQTARKSSRSSSSSYSKSTSRSADSRSDSGSRGSTNHSSSNATLQAPLKKYRRPSLSPNSSFEDGDDDDEDKNSNKKDSLGSKSEHYKILSSGSRSVATSKVNDVVLVHDASGAA